MSANSGRSPADATTLIHNAKIYCFDEGDSTADSILLQAGRVATIGRHSDLISLTDGATETLDLRGATVLPGLIDTHPHLLHFAARQAPLVDISDATSHDGIVERIAARAQTTAAGDWIMTTPVGEAWYFIRRSYKDLSEGELPTRQTLDRATSRHPVVIMAWEPNIPNTVAFNSMALAKLGVTRELPDQVSGVIIEKDEQCEPTGRLHERSTACSATTSLRTNSGARYRSRISIWFCRQLDVPSLRIIGLASPPSTKIISCRGGRLTCTGGYATRVSCQCA
jgi:predicted amidohydrolase YtcJ